MTRQQAIDIILKFLELPGEALPSATYLEEGDEYAGSPWSQLGDYVLPEPCQGHNHLGERVLLRAAREGWREGVVVELF